MKAKLIPLLSLLTLSGAAIASSCPMLMSDIDAALVDPAVQQRLSDEELKEAKRLREEGAEAHRAGDHGESVETLSRAKEILGIS